MWVKVCGITNLEDALAAVEAGADALGFIFVGASRRAVSRKTCSEILGSLPPTMLTVGVVADEDPTFLRDLLRVCSLGALQFHGEEPPEVVLSFKSRAKVIKAIRVKDAGSLEQIPRYRGVDAILLDTHRPGRKGGTGVPFDWALAADAKKFGIPIVVAGGLNPGNVQDVVRAVGPYGVDVASGVESAPGRKDHALVREFVAKARVPEVK